MKDLQTSNENRNNNIFTNLNNYERSQLISKINEIKAKRSRKNNNISKNKKRSVKNINFEHYGGKKLGEGAFGCVVTPPILCKSTKDKYNSENYISKLISVSSKADDEDTIKEINVSQLIKRLDPESKYFTFSLDNCFFRKPKEDRDDLEYFDKKSEVIKKNKRLRDKCKIIKSTRSYNLIQKHAGINLDDILIYSEYKKEREIIKTRTKSIFRHLLIGLRKFHNYHLVNHDIKPDNMGIKINRNSTNKVSVTYFDFGLTEVFSRILGGK